MARNPDDSRKSPPDPLDDLDALLRDEDDTEDAEEPESPPSHFEDLMIVGEVLDEDDTSEEGDSTWEPVELIAEPAVDDSDEPSGEPEPSGWDDDGDDLLQNEVPDDAEDQSEPGETNDEAWSDVVDEPPDDTDWTGLEVEHGALLPGRVLVGFREFVSLPDLGFIDIVARFDTGEDRSQLCCEVQPAETGFVTLVLGEHQATVRAEDEDGHLVIRQRVRIGGKDHTMRLRVCNTPDAHPVVLGRDAQEGYFVVDVALSFTHQRENEPG